MMDKPNPREIDLETWPRREPFEFFQSYGIPHVGLTAPIDISRLRTQLKEAGISFTVGWVHTVASAANAVPALRQRLHDGRVVEFNVVHPAITVLTERNLFAFCTLPFEEELAAFAPEAERRIAAAKTSASMYIEPDRDDFLFMTAMPWVAFTGFMHPMTLDPTDTVPRFAWGRFVEEGGRTTIPLNIQAHHAFVDGIHMGDFYREVEGRIERGISRSTEEFEDA